MGEGVDESNRVDEVDFSTCSKEDGSSSDNDESQVTGSASELGDFVDKDGFDAGLDGDDDAESIGDAVDVWQGAIVDAFKDAEGKNILALCDLLVGKVEECVVGGSWLVRRSLRQARKQHQRFLMRFEAASLA